MEDGSVNYIDGTQLSFYVNNFGWWLFFLFCFPMIMSILSLVEFLIIGAKQPNYLITADDVDKYLAIEVQPLDNRKRKVLSQL